MTTTLYKFLKPGGVPAHGGIGVWSLPQGETPGAWMPAVEGKLVLCVNGYHLIEASQLIDWLATDLYEAEGRYDHISDGKKSVWRSARLPRRVEAWNRQTARLFVADVAGHVLPVFENYAPADDQATRWDVWVAEEATRAASTVAAAAMAAGAGWAVWPAAMAKERAWQSARLVSLLGLELLTRGEA